MDKKIILFLLLLMVVFTVVFIYNLKPETDTREIEALVNGQPIYSDEIDKELTTLSAEQQETVERIDVIDFLVEKRLLIQAAQEEGIFITQEEIDQLRKVQINPYLSRVPGIIAKQNLTPEELTDKLTEQAVINKLFDKKKKELTILKNEEVRSIYETDYKDKNVSFEDVEAEIVQFLIDRKQANIILSYINSLKLGAEIDILI
ncbi:hypothetical protein CMO88_04725 [Candidatus Woesearchaeota archaeon]|nr:hypothetical protein [Candidatus Woesearchaeota archaeon]|tara:strand:- start:11302 stop:11913 length:612 start_codon:yes stop_codon:yes gene_type:complete